MYLSHTFPVTSLDCVSTCFLCLSIRQSAFGLAQRIPVCLSLACKSQFVLMFFAEVAHSNLPRCVCVGGGVYSLELAVSKHLSCDVWANAQVTSLLRQKKIPTVYSTILMQVLISYVIT